MTVWTGRKYIVEPDAKAVVGRAEPFSGAPVGHSSSLGKGGKPDAVAEAVAITEEMLPSTLEALETRVSGTSSLTVTI